MLLEDDGSGPGGDEGGSEGGEVGGAVVAIMDRENFLTNMPLPDGVLGGVFQRDELFEVNTFTP